MMKQSQLGLSWKQLAIFLPAEPAADRLRDIEGEPWDTP